MGRVIGLKAGTIEGDVSVIGAEKNIVVHTLSMGAASQITYDSGGGGNVDLSGITLSIKYGQWIGDLQKALFEGMVFPEVTIVEIDQKSEGQAAADAKLVRTVKLTNAYLDSMAIGWTGPDSTCVLSFSYEKWDLTYEAKSGAKMASRDLMATT